jgi:hypothetical protein
LTYFFIGVLKAVKIAKVVIAKWRSAEAVYLFDDDGYWAKIFKEISRIEQFPIRLISVFPKGKKENKPLQRLNAFLKTAMKALFSLRDIPSCRHLARGGVLYSSSPRFVEPLWKFDDSQASYYLRPEYSVKVSTQIKKKYRNIRPILPCRLGDRSSNHLASQWKKEKNFPECIRNYFRRSDFFHYEGINLWPLLEEDFIGRLNQRFDETAPWVCSLQEILESLEPRILIVDEDVTPFNQSLVELGKAKNIPSIQILHGIMGPFVHLVPIRTTKMVVPGPVSKERLVGFGAEEEKIEVIGAAHYEARREERNRPSGGAVHKALGLSNEIKIVTLATHFFHTEEKPDWIGAMDSPEKVALRLQIALRSVRGLPNVKLIIKLHPRETNEWFIQEILESEKALGEAIVLKHFDIFKLIRESDLVLCASSSVYWEALFLDRPIIIFDESKRRRLAHMSEEFLDLSAPELAEAQLRQIILSEALKRERVERQGKEKNRHFMEGNKGSIERFWKLINELTHKPSEAVMS